MDPQACYTEMLYLDAAGEYEDAAEHARNLKTWLDKGGFLWGNGRVLHASVHADIRMVLENARAAGVK